MNTAEPAVIIIAILYVIGFVLAVSWTFLPWLLLSRLRRMHDTLEAIRRQGTTAATAKTKADRELLGF
jgi:hypothetical protein